MIHRLAAVLLCNTSRTPTDTVPLWRAFGVGICEHVLCIRVWMHLLLNLEVSDTFGQRSWKREERLKQSPNRDRQQTDGHAGRALSATPMAEKSSETLLCVKSSVLNEELCCRWGRYYTTEQLNITIQPYTGAAVWEISKVNSVKWNYAALKSHTCTQSGSPGCEVKRSRPWWKWLPFSGSGDRLLLRLRSKPALRSSDLAEGQAGIWGFLPNPSILRALSQEGWRGTSSPRASPVSDDRH